MSDLVLGQALGEGLKSFPRTTLIYACVGLVGAIGLTAIEIATKIPAELSLFAKVSTPTPDEYQPIGLYSPYIPEKEIPIQVAAIAPVERVAKEPAEAAAWSTIQILDLFQSYSAVTAWPSQVSSTADLPASSAFLVRAASMPSRSFQSLFEWSALAWNGDQMSSPNIVANIVGVPTSGVGSIDKVALGVLFAGVPPALMFYDQNNGKLYGVGYNMYGGSLTGLSASSPTGITTAGPVNYRMGVPYGVTIQSGITARSYGSTQKVGPDSVGIEHKF
jgi:hypothetical protein